MGKTKHKKKAHPVLIIILSLALLFFIGLMIYYSTNLVTAFGAADWKEVPCRIVSCQLKHYDRKSDLGVDIVYDYSYRGKSYFGTNFNFSNKSATENYLGRMITEAYAPNTKTVCYVNPANPKQSVIINKIDFNSYLRPVISLIAIVILLSVLIPAVKSYF